MRSPEAHVATTPFTPNAPCWYYLHSLEHRLCHWPISSVAACHYHKQPQGMQVAMNLERDSDWETSAIENSGHQRHANKWFAASAQYAYSDIALATRMGSGENLKHMSWRPLRHSAGQRWKLCEQEQKNGEAVSCTSWAALVNHSYTTEFYWYKLMLCQMAMLLS